MSSDEEDVKLKDLVMQTLEDEGVLALMRAQLRAGVFLAIEDSNKGLLSKMSPKLVPYLADNDVKLLFGLVREFLDFFGLSCTMSVFDTETLLGKKYQYNGREDIINRLGLTVDENVSVPLMLEILKSFQSNREKYSTPDSKESVSESEIQPVTKVLTTPKADLNQTYVVDSSPLRPVEVEATPVEDGKQVEIILSPRSLNSSASQLGAKKSDELSSIIEESIAESSTSASENPDSDYKPNLLGDLPPLNTNQEKADLKELQELMSPKF